MFALQVTLVPPIPRTNTSLPASEIVSYLLFDPSFCTQLIEVGYEDGMKQKEEIRKFIED
jgi:hypothetical protein